ncbi:tetratricopeptide repeat protein [Larsenimonas rhizosphaerae]|uniref:Tetratricopeptide repeat protein n=1 Tax=Larsenimonas rhizosphaerae TaxID=2944682 RepID=A0AA41ZFY2_9GAMM|nr:hypothetical protein [Larsenimonas rhizosphaerae]MCX2523825.1 hypothetical protein [Larsenimonas rhizosphaerae]
MGIRTLFFPIVAIGLGTLNGCAAPATPSAFSDRQLMYTPNDSDRSADLERLLTAELAASRGQFETATREYLSHGERMTTPAMAERATRLAGQTNDELLLRQTASLWAEVAPANPLPRHILAELAGSNRDWPEALTLLLTLPPDERPTLAGFIDNAIHHGADAKGFIPPLQRHIAAHPTDQEARLALILADIHADRLDVARQRYQQERPESIRSTGVNYWLVGQQLWLADRQPDRAIASARAGLAVHPNDYRLTVALIQARLAAGEPERTRPLTAQLLARTDDDTSLRLSLARLHLGYKAPEQAMALLSPLLDTDQPEGLLLAASAATQQNNPSQALVYYERIPEGSAFMAAQRQAVALLLDINQPDDAVAWLQAQRDRHPHYLAELAASQVALLDRLDAPGQGDQLLNDLIDNHPDHNDDLLYLRAMRRLNQQKTGPALDDLRLLVERHPDQPHLLNAYGYTLADLTDRSREAIALLEKAHRLAPDDPAIQDSLGWAYTRAGRYREGILLLKQAYNDMPDEELAAHLAEALWLDRHRPQALAVINDALERFEEHPTLDDLLSRHPSLRPEQGTSSTQIHE